MDSPHWRPDDAPRRRSRISQETSLADASRVLGHGVALGPCLLSVGYQEPDGEWCSGGSQAASRRRAFCTLGSAALAFASGRARTSTLAGLRAIVISSPVAGLRP